MDRLRQFASHFFEQNLVPLIVSVVIVIDHANHNQPLWWTILVLVLYLGFCALLDYNVARRAKKERPE